jgi:hypothetical protein
MRQHLSRHGSRGRRSRKTSDDRIAGLHHLRWGVAILSAILNLLQHKLPVEIVHLHVDLVPDQCACELPAHIAEADKS